MTPFPVRYQTASLAIILIIAFAGCVQTRPGENQNSIEEIVSRANADFYLDVRIEYS